LSARSIMKLDTYHSGTRSFVGPARFAGIGLFLRRGSWQRARSGRTKRDAGRFAWSL
jgi:hypothetical protein